MALSTNFMKEGEKKGGVYFSFFFEEGGLRPRGERGGELHCSRSGGGERKKKILYYITSAARPTKKIGGGEMSIVFYHTTEGEKKKKKFSAL